MPGGALDGSGNYIPDSAVAGYYDFDDAYRCDSVLYEDQKIVYCGYFRKHWGDFIVDCVNRLWFYLCNDDETIDYYVYFVDEDKSMDHSGNFQEYFDLLGVGDRIKMINRPTKFREVIVPESAFHRQFNEYSPLYLSIFDQIKQNVLALAEGDATIYPEKIFFTRSALGKAQCKEYGMDMIDDYFRINGFEIVAPEKHTLREQVLLIHHADVVASISGTLPHNLLFGHEDQRLIIIERNALNNFTQPYISRLKNIETIYIDAQHTIYPVELAYGPFIYANTKWLKQFTEDHGYQQPDPVYESKRYLKNIFRSYMKFYQNEYYMTWYMGGATPWMKRDIDILYEAHEEGAETFKPWIKDREPYRLTQHFEGAQIKKAIKRMLRVGR